MFLDSSTGMFDQLCDDTFCIRSFDLFELVDGVAECLDRETAIVRCGWLRLS